VYANCITPAYSFCNTTRPGGLVYTHVYTCIQLLQHHQTGWSCIHTRVYLYTASATPPDQVVLYTHTCILVYSFCNTTRPGGLVYTHVYANCITPAYGFCNTTRLGGLVYTHVYANCITPAYGFGNTTRPGGLVYTHVYANCITPAYGFCNSVTSSKLAKTTQQC